MKFNQYLKNNKQDPQFVTLNAIENLYDVYFIDLWGVMHNGKDSFPKAIEAVNHLLDKHKTVIFLSNMPRPKELVFKTMTEYGVKEGYHVITSGDCARDYLVAHHKQDKVYHFGKDVNTDILHNLEVTTTDSLEEADVFLITLFVDSRENLTPYVDICKKIAKKNKPVICANPDHLAIHGSTTRITAGHFSKIIEENGCHVHFIGKPFMTIYEFAFKKFNINPQQQKCLMIGDTIETDILGGFNASMDTCLTLSGITNEILTKKNESLVSYCEENMYPLPTYVMKELSEE
jgi:HAD superfamily hydrolase (TIGR01459 family)